MRLTASATKPDGASLSEFIGTTSFPEQQNITYTENSEADHLYRIGRFFWNKRTAEGLKKAVDYFQQAIDRDPNMLWPM